MPELKIVSYNIYDGFMQENIVNNVFNFAQEGARIICLQEVRHGDDKGFIGDIILKKLGSDWQGHFFLSSRSGSYDNGLAILWHSSVRSGSFETLSFPKLKGLGLHERFLEWLRKGPLKPIQRAALIGEFEINSKKIRVSNVHLDWHGWSEHRVRQLDKLISHLRIKSTADAEIICGDLNTLGFFGYGRKFDKIQKMLGREYVSAFPKFEHTTTHYQHLDHIYVKNLGIKKAEILNVEGSDHYPISATVSI